MSTNNSLDNELKKRVLISFFLSNENNKDEIFQIFKQNLFRNSNNDKAKNTDPLIKGSFSSWAYNVIRESKYINLQLTNIKQKENGLLSKIKQQSDRNLDELKNNFNNLINEKDLVYGDEKWNLSNDKTKIVKELLTHPEVINILKDEIKKISEEFIGYIKKLSEEVSKNFTNMSNIIDKNELFNSPSFGFAKNQVELNNFAIKFLIELDSNQK